MKLIDVKTSNTRGFLKNLFDFDFKHLSFYYEKKDVYEYRSKWKKTLARVVKWKIFDFLGVFRIVKSFSNDGNFCFSYNRFLKTNKPYVIYLENPSALVNYSWSRPNHFLSKRKLKRCFADENLKAIVCMSKKCYDTFLNFYDLPSSVLLLQTYPLITDCSEYTIEKIKEKVNQTVVECLFISSEYSLKGGQNIRQALQKLIDFDIQLHVTFIVKIDAVPKEEVEILRTMKNVSLVNFSLSKSELDNYYKKASILINPTRFDSFSLVTLEAMKFGLTLLATDVYAISEFVENEKNGYLCKPVYNVWNLDGSVNSLYRNSGYDVLKKNNIDEDVVVWLVKHLKELCENRLLLEKMCVASLLKSRQGDFSEKTISEFWENLFLSI